MGREPQRDFFVSYTAADEAWARWIAVVLEQAGYTTVVQWNHRQAPDLSELKCNCDRPYSLRLLGSQAATTVKIALVLAALKQSV